MPCLCKYSMRSNEKNIKNFSKMPNRRKKLKLFLCACAVIGVYYFFGVHDYINSRDIEDGFDYPLDIDLRPQVRLLLAGRAPTVPPINHYPYHYLTNSEKCKTSQKIDLFIAVKSAVPNLGYRNAIRLTYGQEDLIPGRVVKILFFIGVTPDDYFDEELQDQIGEEMFQNRDVIQMDFIDSYYNNTVKTMMTFRWLNEHCSSAAYYLFTDDDMYVSVPALFDYVQQELEPARAAAAAAAADAAVADADAADPHLYIGYVFESTPHRIRSSKWRVSLAEYPWNRWPPYVTAGAYLLSNRSMKTLYAASLFVKHFRFDDVYLGIVAKKVGVTPKHCDRFYFYKKSYDKAGYRDVIASHGYDDHDELIRVWTEQTEIRNGIL